MNFFCSVVNSLLFLSNLIAAQKQIDYGSCPIPEMNFGLVPSGINPSGMDLRFRPKNGRDAFKNFESYLNPVIVANFICSQLKGVCNAPADTNAKCSQATKALIAAPKGGAQADAFNKALGIRTNYAKSSKRS
jgi:hypothetical protein